MAKRVNLMSTLIILFFLFLGSSISLGNEVSLTLIYTSNTLGEVEPCGTCPEGGDNGGLARRAHYIKTVKEEVKNLLILDGGDALVISYFGQTKRKRKSPKKSRVCFKVYENIRIPCPQYRRYRSGIGNRISKKSSKKFEDSIPLGKSQREKDEKAHF